MLSPAGVDGSGFGGHAPTVPSRPVTDDIDPAALLTAARLLSTSAGLGLEAETRAAIQAGQDVGGESGAVVHHLDLDEAGVDEGADPHPRSGEIGGVGFSKARVCGLGFALVPDETGQGSAGLGKPGTAYEAIIKIFS